VFVDRDNRSALMDGVSCEGQAETRPEDGGCEQSHAAYYCSETKRQASDNGIYCLNLSDGE